MLAIHPVRQEKRTVSITVADVYQVPFVIPSSQNVMVLITSNTVSDDYVDPAGIAMAVQQNVADYINSIEVGHPINLLRIQDIFTSSVKLLVDATLISTISVSIGINGHIVLPAKDTSPVYGDTLFIFQRHHRLRITSMQYLTEKNFSCLSICNTEMIRMLLCSLMHTMKLLRNTSIHSTIWHCHAGHRNQ